MFANVFTKTTLDRWRGAAIAAVSLALLFVFGMSTYRDIDLTLYTDLPEVFQQLAGIPEDSDVASLSYGVILGSYGALIVAAMAIAMGAATIAAEERNGTIGLLLGNPRSRTSVLVAKTASMVFLVGLMALLLWVAGITAPAMLDVSIAGMHIGALIVHLFAVALFFGFLAVAVGAWTGSPGAANGTAAGVLFVSFMGAGLFPMVEGWENAAKAFPWYYFNSAKPEITGIDWGHIGVLTAGIVVFAVAALVGVNRRDLKSQTVGTTLIDRLRANPLTQKAADRLAGSARVSKIWIKTASEYQGMLFIDVAVMFLFMGVMIGPMYAMIDEALLTFADAFPPEMLALFGGGDMSTPEGFYQIETFGMMAPIAVMIVTVTIGA